MMAERTGRRAGRILIRMLCALTAVLLWGSHPSRGRAEVRQSDLTEAAFELLEAGNPFARRYEELTGRTIEPLFPDGVPYFFGGLSGAKGSGWFYLSYPYYHVHVCESGSTYFHRGQSYFYGLDCSGFVRHVYRACGKTDLPTLQDILIQWSCRARQVYSYREEEKTPPWDQLKNTLEVGDLLVVKHEESGYRHVMMYIGTLRDFGYTEKEEPALAPWMDYPLVIHCGNNPSYGERFQKLIDENPERYGMCTTTDGGVAVSLIGLQPSDAPEHGHVQLTDYDWFTMNDGGYLLTVVNLNDVKYYAWYRP